MGAPLGSKCIPRSYMDPLGSATDVQVSEYVFQVDSGSLRRLRCKISTQNPSCAYKWAPMRFLFGFVMFFW